MMSKSVYYLFTALLIFPFACNNSTDKNSDVPEGLAGSWIWRATELNFGHSTEFQQIIFTKTSAKSGTYEQYTIADFPEKNNLTIILAFRGTFTLRNDTLYAVETEVGSEMGIFGPADAMELSDTTVWYPLGELPSEGYKAKTRKIKFTLKGDTLIIRQDGHAKREAKDIEEDLFIYLRE